MIVAVHRIANRIERANQIGRPATLAVIDYAQQYVGEITLSMIVPDTGHGSDITLDLQAVDREVDLQACRGVKEGTLPALIVEFVPIGSKLDSASCRARCRAISCEIAAMCGC